MARQMALVAMIVGCWLLSMGPQLGAEPPKVRTDLTGRANLTPEEVIQGLKPQSPEVRTRGLKPATTRGLQPGLSTIAVTVQFAFDSAEILPQAVPNLQSLGKALASPQLAPYQIRIEGHTDSTGPTAYNQGLSQRRANSVKQYLVQHFDISADRLFTEGRGEDEPIDTNATRAGRAKNRRAEFVNLSPMASQ
jgi:outer membrane protein OmpA-like peptidoglycan-associated protein